MNSSEPPGPPKANALAKERSPYLRQHQHNPVNWLSWGDEAFEEARRQQKPLFVSIGYATCHWCHVMAHESFEDAEVAALLNEHFVCVKVDREERPDVDASYMAVCQAMTGHGGWPLSVFITPDKQPFYVGTYWPKEDRYGRAGFMTILRRLSEMWANDRATLVESAGNVVARMSEHRRQEHAAAGALDAPRELLAAAHRAFADRFDATFGGFGSHPKFPSPHQLQFLLRSAAAADVPAARAMALKTLDGWRLGGTWDHIGFGFHRYSTDREFLLPHFEKMLYDQATMMMAAADAYAVTQDEWYASVVDDVAEYLNRDMSTHLGAFCSAEDADSEGEEGRFYVWGYDEFHSAVANAEEALSLGSYWNIRRAGNYRDEATGEPQQLNIPHAQARPLAWAKAHGAQPEEFLGRLAQQRAKLHEYRSRRIRPLLDDKVLADWNGLAVAALARAGRLLRQPLLVRRAADAFDAVESLLAQGTLADPSTELFHRWHSGQAAVPAFRDDHAFIAWAAFELYQATLEARWLCVAVARIEHLIEHFLTPQGDALANTSARHEQLPIVAADYHDGAIPSGNAVAAMLLVLLGKLLSRTEWLALAEVLLAARQAEMQKWPTGYAAHLMALELLTAPTAEVVVAGPAADADTALADSLNAALLGNGSSAFTTVIGKVDQATEHLFRSPYQRPAEGLYYYVCKDFTCSLPATTLQEMQQNL